MLKQSRIQFNRNRWLMTGISRFEALFFVYTERGIGEYANKDSLAAPIVNSCVCSVRVDYRRRHEATINF